MAGNSKLMCVIYRDPFFCPCGDVCPHKKQVPEKYDYCRQFIPIYFKLFNFFISFFPEPEKSNYDNEPLGGTGEFTANDHLSAIM